MRKLFYRVRRSIRSWLVAVDQLAFVVLATPYYLAFGGEPPSERETISSRVGREANNGWLWAKVAEFGIDLLFRLCASPWGHCQRAILAPCVLAGGSACGAAKVAGALDRPQDGATPVPGMYGRDR